MEENINKMKVALIFILFIIITNCSNSSNKCASRIISLRNRIDSIAVILKTTQEWNDPWSAEFYDTTLAFATLPYFNSKYLFSIYISNDAIITCDRPIRDKSNEIIEKEIIENINSRIKSFERIMENSSKKIKVDSTIQIKINKKTNGENIYNVLSFLIKTGFKRFDFVFLRNNQPKIMRIPCPDRFRKRYDKINIPADPSKKATVLSDDPPFHELIYKKCHVDWIKIDSLPRHERLQKLPELILSSMENCNCNVNDDEVLWLYQIQLPKYFYHILPVVIDEKSLIKMKS